MFNIVGDIVDVSSLRWIWNTRSLVDNGIIPFNPSKDSEERGTDGIKDD